MVLEATVIIIDNSEWTRNGDYSPSRLEASKEAANYLATKKLTSNVENCVAVMTMGGQNPKCLLSLTSDQGKVATAIGLIGHEEGCKLESSIQVAQIVLKHRQNTNQRQRIVVFLASPLPASASTSLEDFGKKLKKNGIALDIIDFGTENRSNTAQLEPLIAAVDSEAAPSRLVSILPAPGQILLEAIIANAPEVVGRVGGSGAGGEGAGDFEFGVDPELDPELAMALKLSMEEEMARQKRECGSENKQESAEQQQQQQASEETFEDAMEDGDEDEEMMLAKAIAMSMEQSSEDKPSKL